MIVPLTSVNARYIAHHLRDSWRREVFAGMPGINPEQELNTWADSLLTIRGPSLCLASPEGEPIAMGGIIPMGHMAQTWCAGTNRTDEVAVPFMREVLRAHRALMAQGVRRFQAYCLDGPPELFVWLDRLGYVREGVHPGMGINGETFLSFGRVY